MKLTAYVCLGALVVALLACKQGKSEATPSSSAAPAGIQLGQTVVARWSTGSYYEGKVQKVAGSLYTVEWSDGSTPAEVEGTQVFSVPQPGADPGLSAGDFAIAKWSTGTKWYGAKVLSAAGGYRVRYSSDATESDLSADKLLKAPPDALEYFKKALAEAEMLKAARSAGKPAKPAGWKPRKGERVLAVWTVSDWYVGQVDSVKTDSVVVKWKDGSQPSDVPLEKVAAFPTASSPAAKEGEYVLFEPLAGASSWQYGKVTGVDGSSVTVSGLGGSHDVGAGKYLVLRSD